MNDYKKTKPSKFGKTGKPESRKSTDRPSFSRPAVKTADKPSSARTQKEDRPTVAARENAVAGRNPIFELLKSGRTIEKLYVAKGEEPAGSAIKILAMARDRGIVVVEAGRAKLEDMCGTSSHQGMVAITTDYKYYDVEDIFAVAEERGEKPFILVLDGISDPGNFGAIIRTADCCGIHGIIIPKRGSCGMTATAIKASAGASEYVKVAKVVNIAETISMLKKKNVWIFGTSGKAEKSIYDQDMTGSVAIVLGDEGKGISELVAERCDYLVKIPMSGHVDSLNVSVAGAVTMYEAVKQRRK